MSHLPPIFVRHQMGDTPGQPSQGGWSASPDIIFAQNNTPDPATLVTTANYNTQPSNVVNIDKFQPVPNNVYLRGLATGSVPNPRMWFYYVPCAIALWPASWQSLSIQYQGKQQNYADLAPLAQNQIFVTPTPMVWSAPPLPSTSQHYCGVLLATDTSVTDPRPVGKFNTLNDLIAFILANNTVGWANTTDVVLPGPGLGQTLTIPYTSPATPGKFWLGVQTTNLPTDGTFDFVVPAPPGDTPISAKGLPIPFVNYGLLVPITWKTPSFSTSITITYYPGATAVPGGANIQAVIGSQKASVLETHGHIRGLAASAERRAVQMFAANPFTFEGSDPLDLLLAGSYTWNLKQ